MLVSLYIQINFVFLFIHSATRKELIQQTVKMKENKKIIWKNCVNISRITNNVNYASSDCQTQLHSEEWTIFIYG